MKSFLTKNFKKILCLVMVAALVVGTINLGGRNVNAATDNVGSSEVVGYASVNEDGEFSFDQNQNVVYDKATNEAAYTSNNTEAGIKVSKQMVADNDSSDPFGYDITLTVETEQTITTQDTAVVLVMDVSGSMGENIVGTTTKKLTSAQSAAKSFVDSIAKNAKGNVKISLVSFASSAKEACGWKDVKNNSEKTALTNSIDGLKAKGGTNLDEALQKANSLLNNSAVSTYGNKYVVVLTDGVPTESKNYGDGTNCSYYICQETAETAKKVTKSAKLFSIYFGSLSDKCYSWYSWGWHTYTVGDFLNSISSIVKEVPGVFAASDLNSLNAAFGNTLDAIIEGSDGTGWVVTDPMGPFVQYDSTNSVTLGTNNTLNWVLDPDKATTSTTGNKTTYTYTYTYHVTLNVADAAFADNTPYLANGVTTLTHDGETEFFKVPVFEGVAPQYDVTVNYYIDNKLVAGKSTTTPVSVGKSFTYSDLEDYTADTEGKIFDQSKTERKIDGVVTNSLSVPSMPAEDVTIEVYYSHKTYTVKFMNDNETVLSKTYFYNDEITVPENPTKAQDERNVYTFKAWTPEVSKICVGDATYKATYDSTDRMYTVKFVDDNGTELSSEQYKYGYMPVEPTKPTKTATDVYSYEFKAWSPAVSEVTGDATYTATYNEIKNKYTVTFYDYDGKTVLGTGSYEWGDKIKVPQNPERGADNTYTYEFTGWNKDVAANCNGNAEYTAQYKSTYINYTITFKNYDGTVLSEKTDYHYGETIVAPTETPVKAEDDTNTYTFNGWNHPVTTVTKNDTFIATYKSEYIDYEVTFVDYNGKQIGEPQTLHYGDTIVVPSDPERAADNTFTYTFAGWNPQVPETCVGTRTYTATYNPEYIDYTVKFFRADGTTLIGEPLTLHYGDAVVAPTAPEKAADVENTYTFDKWSPDFVAKCEGNAEYTATYKPTAIDYTVLFKSEDGKGIVSELTLNYGDAITVPGVQTKDADETYTYTFKGWRLEGENEAAPVAKTCSGDATYYAVFEAAYIDYTVKFISDGQVISEEKYHYGATPVQPDDPEKAADKAYTYEFAGWDKAVVNVTEDAVYTAKFNEKAIGYTVKFIYEDGTNVVEPQGLNYNNDIVKPDDPSMDADNTYTYTFKGWRLEGEQEISDVADKCTGNATYIAVFEANYIEYTVTFIDWDDKQVEDPQKLHYGNKITTPKDPSRADTNVNSYTFAGWRLVIETETGKDVDPDSTVASECTGNATYKATYTPTKREYKVSFNNYDGSEIASDMYIWGAAIKEPETPVKPEDNTYTYTFDGWDKDVVPCAGNETYTATFTPVYKNYTVTFVNEGAVVTAASLHYGDAIVVPADPEKAADKTYTYKFNSWNPVVPATCEGTKTYEATYTPEYINYTVTYMNGEEVFAEFKELHYGVDTPTAENDPAKAATSQFTYTFNGWAPEVAETVEGNVTYYAQYTSADVLYDVTFVDYDGRVLKIDQVKYEGAATAPADPSRASVSANGGVYSYRFEKWDKDFSVITESITVQAVYTESFREDNPYIPVIIPDDGGDDETEEEIIIPDVPQGDIEVEPTPEVTPEPTVDIEVPEVPEALPKTGTVPNGLFFGLGGLLLLCGAALVMFGRRKES